MYYNKITVHLYFEKLLKCKKCKMKKIKMLPAYEFLNISIIIIFTLSFMAGS